MGKKRKTSTLLCNIIILITLILVAGCNYPSMGSGGNWRDTIGVQIVAPADGSQWHVGDEIEISSRVSAPNVVKSLTLFVNGKEIREDLFAHPTFYSGTIFQKWIPKAVGIYTLQTWLTDAMDKADSNIITIQVVEADLSTLSLVEQDTLTPTITMTILPTMATFTPTTTITLTPTITITTESTKPEGTAEVNLNCRRGPGTVYETVWYLPQGQTVPLVGRSQDSTWLVVERSDGLGQCWVSAGYLTINVAVGSLTVIAAPPLPPTTTFTVTASPYTSCADYPDYATCNADPMGFGGCTWDTGLNKCQ
jgi:uncharacterized protein YraI